MADSNEIGAKLVLSGDASGARKSVQEVTSEVAKIVQETTAGDRAMAKLDAQIRGLSTTQLREIEARLQAIVAGGGAGLNVDGYRAQLARIQEAIAEASQPRDSGQEEDGPLDRLKEKLGEVAGEIPGLSGALGGFGEVTGAVASGPVAVLAAAIGSLAGGIELANKAIEEFSQDEAAVTKLDQALAQSGQLTDEFREKVQDLGNELSEATGIGGDRWFDVLAKLTQLGADTSNIEEYGVAVKNLAGLMDGDIGAAGAAFGRAMNGNYRALAMLGIEVDKNATEHERLESIMQQLAQRGGGQLEAQTRTISGRFNALSEAVGDVFANFGNLISRTGVVQAGLELLAKGFGLISSILPGTIEKVEGITNMLPTTGIAFRDTGDAAEEAGGEMAEMGDSADGAVDGLAKLSAGAEKAKAAYSAAATAAKELRERQDALADAAQAERLAGINLREANHELSPQDAENQRAKVRADAERAKYERQITEQESIIKAAQDRTGKAGATTSSTSITAQAAQAEVERLKKEFVAQFGGFTGVENVNADSIKPGANVYNSLANAQRGDAEEKRAAANNLRAQGSRTGFRNEDTARKLLDEADTADQQAEAYDKLAAALAEATRRRIDATKAAQEEAAVIKEANKERERAMVMREATQGQMRAAGLTATAEDAKRAREQEKQRIETEQQRLAASLRDDVQADKTAKEKQAKYEANQKKLNELQFGGDKEKLAAANADLKPAPAAEANVKKAQEFLKAVNDQLANIPDLSPVKRDGLLARRKKLEDDIAVESERGISPDLRRSIDFNRRTEQQREEQADFAKNPADAAVIQARRMKAVATGTPVQPGTVSAAAVDAVAQAADKVARGSGRNGGDLERLVTVFEQFTQAVLAKNSRDDARIREVERQAKLALDQIKNSSVR